MDEWTWEGGKKEIAILVLRLEKPQLLRMQKSLSSVRFQALSSWGSLTLILHRSVQRAETLQLRKKKNQKKQKIFFAQAMAVSFLCLKADLKIKPFKAKTANISALVTASSMREKHDIQSLKHFSEIRHKIKLRSLSELPSTCRSGLFMLQGNTTTKSSLNEAFF